MDGSYVADPKQYNFDEDDPRRNRKLVATSLSGNERNRLFMRQDNNFADISLLSGADNLADGRAFAMLDFDNDGWLDIALTSFNSPRLKLYKNHFGKLFPENKLLQINLVGGNSTAQPSVELSNRNGIGAMVRVTYQSGRMGTWHRQTGEGFCAQSSATVKIGCPEDDSITNVSVTWPSGKTSEVVSPKSSGFLTIEEVESVEN